jgi:hypothetical protein
LDRWLNPKGELLPGRAPGAKGEGLTVRELVNGFLAANDITRVRVLFKFAFESGLAMPRAPTTGQPSTASRSAMSGSRP